MIRGRFLILAPFCASALAFAEAEPPPDPAAEAQALKDMQSLLERLAEDKTDQPHQRAETLSALARVREALDSWAASIAYYDKLIGDHPAAGFCNWVFSGALRARVARDGTLAAARAYFEKDIFEASQNNNEMTNHAHRLKNHIEQISKHFSAMAGRHGPPIKPMQGVHFAKGEEPSFWKIVAPPWIYPPVPQKPAPNQPVAPTPAVGLKAPASWNIGPIVPDMNKRVNPINAIAAVQPDTAKRIGYMKGVTAVQPDLAKKIELIPEPAGK
jgi:hypothetical protein